jgi:hypothetical protein
VSACRICGLLLPELDAAICEECLANGNGTRRLRMLDGIEQDDILCGGGDNLGEDESLVGRSDRVSGADADGGSRDCGRARRCRGGRDRAGRLRETRCARVA